MQPADTHAGHWSRAECRRAGFEPDVTTESSDVVFLVRLVASGLASALVPRLALHAAAMSTGTEPTDVAIGRLPEPANRRISTAIRRGSARTPRIIALRDALRAKFSRPCPSTPRPSRPEASKNPRPRCDQE